MWKKDDSKTQSSPASPVSSQGPAVVPPAPASSAPPPKPVVAAAPSVTSSRSDASISQGIRIKGEVTGSEDLFVDGQVDGKLNLSNGALTIGPNGVVNADIDAREVLVNGRVNGNITGRDRIQLSSTGQVSGEIRTERLAIAEGASLRGKVEAGKVPSSIAEVRAAAAAAVASKAAAGSGSAS
jgi:cytoskeletal protein CcmA (bactofilin family)